MVVDDVFAEEAEESAGAVNAAKLRAVEVEHALRGEALAIGGGDEDGELDLASDATKRELAAQEVIRRAVGAGGERRDAFGDELGHGMMGDIEEVIAVQMGDEHLVHRGVTDVLAGDAVHRDAEAGRDERVVAQRDLALGEAHGAAVMVEEIAPGPADEALLRVRMEGAAE